MEGAAEVTGAAGPSGEGGAAGVAAGAATGRVRAIFASAVCMYNKMFVVNAGLEHECGTWYHMLSAVAFFVRWYCSRIRGICGSRVS